MATVTNPTPDRYEIPILGVAIEPGQSVQIDDLDARSIGSPLVVTASAPAITTTEPTAAPATTTPEV